MFGQEKCDGKHLKQMGSLANNKLLQKNQQTKTNETSLWSMGGESPWPVCVLHTHRPPSLSQGRAPLTPVIPTGGPCVLHTRIHLGSPCVLHTRCCPPRVLHTRAPLVSCTQGAPHPPLHLMSYTQSGRWDLPLASQVPCFIMIEKTKKGRGGKTKKKRTMQYKTKNGFFLSFSHFLV